MSHAINAMLTKNLQYATFDERCHNVSPASFSFLWLIYLLLAPLFPSPKHIGGGDKRLYPRDRTTIYPMADIFAVDLCTLTWGNDHTATLKFEPISEFPRHFDGESRLFNVGHFFPRARNKKHLVHPISAAAAAIHNVTINVDKKFSQFERPRMSPICRSACRDGGKHGEAPVHTP